jgi:glycerophosphoryl diester phosphodiesterase
MIGIWIDTSAPYVEDLALYEKVYDMKIDMLTTDFPLEAQQALTQIH